MKEFLKEILLNVFSELIVDLIKEKDMFGDMSFLICVLGLYLVFIVVLYKKINPKEVVSANTSSEK
ncbi:hypothetical protein GMA92_13880 [Turicibacter sanguinis]|uniref:Uncharacterized protein n=1 Tax=Turicibacter sanguinis TaxID=154288 RepID=A0A9X4XGE4_9FIRM|nr:hypothetical protein [Turicibacter sanguinis]MTK73757.1 hypothetical protein [Turicibacter sanguinis]